MNFQQRAELVREFGADFPARGRTQCGLPMVAAQKVNSRRRRKFFR